MNSEVENPTPPPNPEPAKEESAAKPSVPPIEPIGIFTPDVDERCMWCDPFTHQDRLNAGAVLLGDVIKRYVLEYNILIDKTAYDDGKLKGGGYTMTPDEKGAWMFVGDGKKAKKVELEKARDPIGDYYVVPPNSLVYIKLKQELRLPFYLIGRHNLKIRYVYKGLLLGTGPQVDPGFEGHLFIPLHNFTTSEVRVYINGRQNSFVSIDFVRTTPFLGKIDVPANIRTVAALRQYLSASGTPHRILIEQEKVKRRLALEDYLEGAKPRSQLAKFQSNYEAVEKKIRKMTFWTNVERFAFLIGMAGLIVASLNFFRGYVADLKSDVKDVKSILATSDVSAFNKRIAILETNIADLGKQYTSQANVIESNNVLSIKQSGYLDNRLEAIELKAAQLQSLLQNSNVNNSSPKPIK